MLVDWNRKLEQTTCTVTRKHDVIS